MNWQKHPLPTIACGFVLLLLLSCTGLSSSSTEFPTGTFLHEKHQQVVQENQPYRNWAFQFNGDGTWAFFTGDREMPVVSGTYSVDGNLYTEVSSDFAACPFPATYMWSFDGQNLSFVLHGEDDCAERRIAYDGVTYIRQE